MIDKLLQMGDGRLLIPIVVIAAGIVLVRGVFSLNRSRSADRRDFLDLFQKSEAQNDLWLSVAIRHLFGAYLPADLIRQLMSGPQPGRALSEVAGVWDLLDMDDETRELYWRRGLFKSPKARKNAVRLLLVMYFILAFSALWLAYWSVIGRFEGTTLGIAWMYTVLGLFGAFFCLSYSDTLKDADKAARRWLGMQ